MKYWIKVKEDKLAKQKAQKIQNKQEHKINMLKVNQKANDNHHLD